MNPRIIYALAAVVLVGAGALGGVMYATRGDVALDQGVFPSTLPVRAEMHPGELVRNVEVYPDGVTPRHGVAENDNGTITNYWYRPNGTLEKAVTESEADEHGKRKQLRYAEIAADGKTFVYDVEFAADGAKLKETRLADPTTTRRIYFFAEGQTRKDQTIALDNKGWKLVNEDVFRVNGTLVHTLRAGKDGAWAMNDYAEDGIRVVNTKRLREYGVEYIEHTIADDGKTVLRAVEQDSVHTEIVTRRADGGIAEKRAWSGEVNKGSMMVDYFGAGGTIDYDQWWNITKDGKYVLWLLREYRPDGTQWRQIMHDDDGKTIKVELLYSGDGRRGTSNTYLRRTYRPDGTVEKEEDVVKGETLATRTFTPADNLRIVIEAARLTAGAYIAPPQMVPYSPPGPY